MACNLSLTLFFSNVFLAPKAEGIHRAGRRDHEAVGGANRERRVPIGRGDLRDGLRGGGAIPDPGQSAVSRAHSTSAHTVSYTL